jgi:hypothetical protein
MAEPTPSPRRVHPARRARKVVATASVAALAGLGGFMAAQTTASGATTTDHSSTSSDDGSPLSDLYRVDDRGGSSTDPWGSGWGAQVAPGGSSSSSPSQAPDASSHAS